MMPPTSTPTGALPPNSKPPSDWELLAEFADDGMPGYREQLLLQVIAAIQGLSLQPQQIERIHTVVARAVSRVAYREETAPLAPVRVRLWLLRTCTGDCGWGFFVVETKGKVLDGDPATETGHLVQLFLYQERDS